MRHVGGYPQSFDQSEKAGKPDDMSSFSERKSEKLASASARDYSTRSSSACHLSLTRPH
jgi:hypothetical protein